MIRALVLGAVFVVALLAFAIARFPLSSALALSGAREQGLSYQGAYGTIWDGVLVGGAWGRQDLGVVTTRLHVRPLLSGVARLDVQATKGPWAAPNGSANGVARASVALSLNGRVSVRDVTATLDLARVPAVHRQIRDQGGLLSINVPELVIDPEAGCVSVAQGAFPTTVSIRVPTSSDVQLADFSSPIEVRCEGREIVVTMAQGITDSGQQTIAFVNARASVDPAGTAGVVVDVETGDPEFGAFAALMGFQPNDEGYTFQRETRFGGGRRSGG